MFKREREKEINKLMLFINLTNVHFIYLLIFDSKRGEGKKI